MRFHSHHRVSQGLTLIEILLVVAVLVVITSLASPSLLRMMESQKLRKSADLLRAEMARTRVRAMKSGRIQMFRYQVGGSGYLAQPWYANDDAIEASDTQQEFGRILQSSQQEIYDDTPTELPEGVVFLGGETLQDQRSASIDEQISTAQSRERVWSPPLLFYPDGTTSDAIIMLNNKRNQTIEISLRGITGMTQVGDVTRLEAISP
jgi:prepilin-type N-terminal cleavage/methylation domain-containing protein